MVHTTLIHLFVFPFAPAVNPLHHLLVIDDTIMLADNPDVVNQYDYRYRVVMEMLNFEVRTAA